LIVGEDTTAAEKSILPLRVMPELGCLFRVNYLSGTPVLEISGRSGAPQFEPWFAAAVLPSVLKEIYVSICLGLNQMEDSVLSQWVTFFTNAGFSPEFAMGADPLIAETLSKVFENAEDLGIWFSIHNNLLAGEVSSGS
jgi:hypothetical protein